VVSRVFAYHEHVERIPKSKLGQRSS